MDRFCKTYPFYSIRLWNICMGGKNVMAITHTIYRFDKDGRASIIKINSGLGNSPMIDMANYAFKYMTQSADEMGKQPIILILSSERNILEMWDLLEHDIKPLYGNYDFLVKYVDLEDNLPDSSQMDISNNDVQLKGVFMDHVSNNAKKISWIHSLAEELKVPIFALHQEKRS